MTYTQYGEAALNAAKRKLGYDSPPYIPDCTCSLLMFPRVHLTACPALPADTKCAQHFALHAGERPLPVARQCLHCTSLRLCIHP
jgi:hypothetical protein